LFRRTALSAARAGRIVRPADLRFLAIDGGIGAKQRSFHGIARAGRGERVASEMVPGVKAPQVTEVFEAPMLCIRSIPLIPPRANAAVAVRVTPMTTQIAKAFHDLAPDLIT